MVRWILSVVRHAVTWVILWVATAKPTPCAMYPEWPQGGPTGHAVGVSFSFRLMPKAKATPAQIASVRLGVCWCDVGELLGEEMIYETYRVSPTERERTIHYPSLVVRVGDTGRVTAVAPPDPD